MSESNSPRRGILGSVGPAIITASVVLGPGSILTSSRVGCDFGYQMIWVLASAGVLMWSMVALSARLGVELDGTLCEELSQRAGRPIAVLAGGSLFLVAACFQFSNNLAIFAGIEPFVPKASATVLWQTPSPFSDGTILKFGWPSVAVVLVNVAIVTALYGFRHLYRPVELAMKALVGIMIVGFAANLLLATPSLSGVLAGFVPQLPEPREGQNADLLVQLLPVLGMIATTFSVGGAFYQSYLVRQRGWTRENLRQGMIDSAVGIFVLVGITMMILVTSAAVLYGRIEGENLKSAADVAIQLEPLFGQKAMVLFCLGIFAGAFSSFLVNAMIGGTMLADGLGLGGDMDGRWPKLCTVLALTVGMVVALIVQATGRQPVQLIIFAQAMTVLGNPVLAGSMLWLATRGDLSARRAVPAWMKWLATAGFVVVLVLALNTVYKLYGQLSSAKESSAVPEKADEREPKQARLLIPGSIVDEMVAHAVRERPLECCGILGGKGDRACSIYPLENEAHSASEYLATAGLIGPFKEMRARGEEPIAIYHSHPASPAVPSKTDLERNYYPDAVHLIVSLAEPAPRLRAWKLSADSYEEVEYVRV